MSKGPEGWYPCPWNAQCGAVLGQGRTRDCLSICADVQLGFNSCSNGSKHDIGRTIGDGRRPFKLDIRNGIPKRHERLHEDIAKGRFLSEFGDGVSKGEAGCIRLRDGRRLPDFGSAPDEPRIIELWTDFEFGFDRFDNLPFWLARPCLWQPLAALANMPDRGNVRTCRDRWIEQPYEAVDRLLTCLAGNDRGIAPPFDLDTPSVRNRVAADVNAPDECTKPLQSAFSSDPLCAEPYTSLLLDPNEEVKDPPARFCQVRGDCAVTHSDPVYQAHSFHPSRSRP